MIDAEGSSRWRRPRFVALGVVVAIGVVALVLLFFELVLARSRFTVPSRSMEPTIRAGDRVILDENAFDFGGGPQRHDIVIFADPHSSDVENDPCETEQHYVFRVIGLPGELLEIEDGVVSIDRVRLDEPYLHPDGDRNDFRPLQIPARHVFVMGDNRANSADSRSVFGPVPMEVLCGKVIEILRE